MDSNDEHVHNEGGILHHDNNSSVGDEVGEAVGGISGVVTGAAIGSAGASAAAMGSGAFCSAGGSRRSIASTGCAASFCCANTVSGAARHDGLLATSS